MACLWSRNGYNPLAPSFKGKEEGGIVDGDICVFAKGRVPLSVLVLSVYCLDPEKAVGYCALSAVNYGC